MFYTLATAFNKPAVQVFLSLFTDIVDKYKNKFIIVTKVARRPSDKVQ